MSPSSFWILCFDTAGVNLLFKVVLVYLSRKMKKKKMKKKKENADPFLCELSFLPPGKRVITH